MPGLFGDFFDFNHDGKMDSFEKAAEFATFMHIVDEEKKRKEEKQRDKDSLNNRNSKKNDDSSWNVSRKRGVQSRIGTLFR